MEGAFETELQVEVGMEASEVAAYDENSSQKQV